MKGIVEKIIDCFMEKEERWMGFIGGRDVDVNRNRGIGDIGETRLGE
ncbi:hypothetical protein [Bacillus altitudinis]|nr:hypothetical protein [Bacillus altitudinis]